MELRDVAKHVVWYQSPEETLQDKNLFLSHVMTYGTIEDLATVYQSYTKKDFINTLENAPPGVFDQRSWAYWHTILLDQEDIPPLPKRYI